MANGDCPLHPGLERSIADLAKEIRAGNRDMRQEMKEARHERQSITGRMQAISEAVVRIEGKAEGVREATGESTATVNKWSGIWKVMVAALAVTVAVVVAILK